MQVYGNTEGLKTEIKSKYDRLTAEAEAETQKQINEINELTSKEIGLIKEQAKTESESAAREANQRVLNEEKLNAKKEFEGKREELIQRVMEEVYKKAKTVSKSNEYIAFLKNNAPTDKEAQVVGSESGYKKVFPKMKLDNGIIGVKITASDAVYDFTLDNMIRANEELVRRTITGKLFRE